MVISVFPALDPNWPPVRHIEAGWRHLGGDARARVRRRMDLATDRFDPPMGTNEAAMRRFFSFLAHMETIAIEIPLKGLPEASAETATLLEHQLADEIFHATLFATLADQVGGIDDPIPQAERVLDRIRAPEDPRVTHVVLNLIAEAWFETLFEHAATWGIADDVFRIALADEGRHVEEGHVHAGDVPREAIEPAVRAFEEELFSLVQHPRLVLPTLALAGQERFQALSEAYLATHEKALAEIGLAPRDEFEEMTRTLEELRAGDPVTGPDRPRRIEPETQWRETALHLWDTPRHPVMHGWFDVPTGHIPKHQLTPALVAAAGKVWHEYPRINRYTIGGEIYQPAGVNVGVRVTIGDQGEALSTVVIPEAHARSIQDIERLLEAGVRQMNDLGQVVAGLDADPSTEALRDVLRDEEVMGMVPPETVVAPVTISNVGPAGLVAGVGAMPGALGQSVELILGRAEQRPVWDGERYIPGEVATIGASADHRVVDGGHSAQAMARLRDALSEPGVEQIMAREDTVPGDANLDEVTLGTVGATQQQATLLLSCKAPFWLGWICWLFKK